MSVFCADATGCPIFAATEPHRQGWALGCSVFALQVRRHLSRVHKDWTSVESEALRQLIYARHRLHAYHRDETMGLVE